MNLYQYYEQKNTADKPAAVSKAYKVIDRICKEELYSDPTSHISAAGNFSRTELAEALVVLHLVAESRKNDYLVLKAKVANLEDALAELKVE
jgi:hypothetical protein